MSKNPYAQVALTYIRRPFASWIAAVFIIGVFGFYIFGLCNLLRLPPMRDEAVQWVGISNFGNVMTLPRMMTSLLMGAAIFAISVAIHIKDQFAESRSHLIPNFRGAHLMIAAAVTLIFAVVAPSLVAWMTHLRSVGLAALITLVFGLMFWSVLMQSVWMILLLPIQIAISFSESTQIALALIVSGRFEAQAVGLLAVGAALIFLTGLRLARLDEDMPAYHSPMRAGWAGRYQMSGQTQAGAGILPRALQDRFMENNMARWTNHARRASASSWSRVCRWQVGMLTGWTAWLLPIVLLFFFAITVWMIGHDLQKAGAVFPLMMLSMMLPGMFWGSIWRGRIPMLGRELLLPVDRPSYVRQLGMAVAVNQLQLMAGMSIGTTFWIFLTARQSLSFTNLAFVLGIFTLLQPWFFGVGVWFLRYRNLGMQMGGFIGAVYVSMIPAALYAAPGPLDIWRYSALPVAGIVALLGLLITYDAYRRWLVADFD